MFHSHQPRHGHWFYRVSINLIIEWDVDGKLVIYQTLCSFALNDNYHIFFVTTKAKNSMTTQLAVSTIKIGGVMAGVR